MADSNPQPVKDENKSKPDEKKGFTLPDLGTALNLILLIFGTLATVFSCYISVLTFSEPELVRPLIPFLPSATPIVQIQEVPVTVIAQVPVTQLVEVTKEVTKEVVQTQIVEVTSTPEPSPTPSDILFEDHFENNNHGWDLSDSASMANDELTITAKSKDQVWLTLPNNLQIENENYFIQAKMYMGQACDCYGGFGLGFGLGEKDISYHKFFFGNYTDGFLQLHAFISLQDNGKEIFGDQVDRVSFYKPRIISLEVKGGQATLSYDGNSIITKQITPHGKDIGLYVWNNENKNLVFSFDDLVIRELP